MNDKLKVVLVGGALVVAAAVPALAGSSQDDGPDGHEVDVAITGSAMDKASAAALAHMHGGTVTGTEVGDEESYYEVEVTLSDGHQVDVQLDEHFNVVGLEDEGLESED